MKRSPLILAFIVCLLPVVSQALPAGQRNSGRHVVKASQLEGTWISTNLSGDAIWLVVQKVGVDFKKDGTFKAVAVLDGGSLDDFSGPYHMDTKKIRLEPAGQGTLICTYSIKAGVLTLYNAEHGITATFERGALPTKSSAPPSGGMPGMHF